MELLMLLEKRIKALLTKIENLEYRILELEDDRDKQKQLLDNALQKAKR